MNSGYYITQIDHAVTIGTTLTRSWFRGHSRTVNELTPRVFRKDIHFARWHDKDKEFLAKLASKRRMEEPPELALREEFKRLAPALAENLPAPGHNAEWLFLMQHHGLPTRLLDWSESVLVALYFVVSGDHDEDGELWALLPETLNAKSGYSGLPTTRDPVLRYIVNQPDYTPEELREMTGLNVAPTVPLAVLPPMKFPRAVSQLSTFTIHPLESLEPGNAIPELLRSDKYLVRYLIPATSKTGLEKDLKSLGITKASLFRDLDSMAQTVAERIVRTIGYSPPDPPFFGQ